MWESSAALAITPEDKKILTVLVRSGKTEERIAFRARVVLGAAEGKSNNALAKELKTARPTVLNWRRRFAEGIRPQDPGRHLSYRATAALERRRKSQDR